MDNTKQKVIDWLEKEKWYPMVRPCGVELETADLLNKILDDIINRLKKQ